MARLGVKLCSWYRSNRNSIILLYAFTFLLVAVGIGTIIAVNGKLIFADMGGKLVDPMVKSTTSNLSPGIQKGDYSKQLHLFNIISLPLRIAYVLTWIVSVVLLRNYSRKIGRKKFWILVTIPLILYLATDFAFHTLVCYNWFCPFRCRIFDDCQNSIRINHNNVGNFFCGNFFHCLRSYERRKTNRRPKLSEVFCIRVL